MVLLEIVDHALALVSIALVLLTLYLYRRVRTLSPLQLIPGPGWSLPVLGHLHLLGNKPHLTLTDLQNKYGDMMKINMGPYTALVISGKETIKNFCSLSVLVGKPHKFFNSWTKHERYFAFGYSRACLQYRKAALKAIGTFTKNNVDEVAEQIGCDMVKYLSKCSSDGKAQVQQIRASVADLSYYMCFGEKGKARNDEQFSKVMSSLQDVLEFAAQASIADLIPWALYMPSFRRKYNKFIQAQDNLVTLVQGQVERHEQNMSSTNSGGTSPRDLCDILATSIPVDQVKELMSDDKGIGTPAEQTGMLLFAGYETVAVSLTWAILLLATHLEAQDKVYEEVSDGTSGELLEAFILETLRFSMGSPLAMPHMTTEPCMFNGYFVPSDTLVLINLWSGSRDKRVWGSNPDTFQPFRFIDDTSGRVDMTLADHLVAFGSGRRRCVGEQLAKSELRILLRCLISQCHVSLANEEEVVDYWPENNGGRNVPPVVDLKFIPRSTDGDF